jgi:hypothetical protein
MPTSFSELYSGTLKEVFLNLAREQLEQGADGLISADAYAEQGKPDFALAYLLLIDVSDEVKRDIFARSYEQRATLSEQKANEFSLQFHRAFPMIKVEAQKDRQAAQQIRQGRSMRREEKTISLNFAGS